MAGIPLTIYGTGGQTRGFISLEDAMQCMTRLISSPPEAGQYEVVNQISGTRDIREVGRPLDIIEIMPEVCDHRMLLYILRFRGAKYSVENDP